MKRFGIWVLLFMVFAASALAQTGALMNDEADLFTPEQERTLAERANEISTKYARDVVLLTVESIGHQTPRMFAADYYDRGGYGQDDANSGVIFMLSMEQRDWAIVTTGKAINEIHEVTQSAIIDDIIDDLSAGQYYEAYERYLRDIDITFAEASKGTPFGPDHPAQFLTLTERMIGFAIIALIGAAIVTIIVMLVLKSQMRTARPKPNAVDYAREDSFVLERQGDVFLYRTQVRRPRADQSSGSKGGSGTFTSSNGTTHGGSSGKF